MENSTTFTSGRKECGSGLACFPAVSGKPELTAAPPESKVRSTAFEAVREGFMLIRIIRRDKDAGTSKCLNYKPFIQNHSLEPRSVLQVQGRYSASYEGVAK